MKHFFIDKYGYLDSPLHRASVVIKTVLMTSFLIYMLISPASPWNYLVCFLLLLCLVFISKVPPAFVFARTFVILPFLLFVTIFVPFLKEDGLRVFFITLARGYLSMLAIVLFVSTTKFPHLLRGLSRMGMPKIMIVLLSFMYRYFFVLEDEMEKMRLGVKARSGKIAGIKVLCALASAAGMLFIRSYERSERLYAAMLMRGFTGEIKDL